MTHAQILRDKYIEYTMKMYGRVLISIVIESMKEQVVGEQGGFRSGMDV